MEGMKETLEYPGAEDQTKLEAGVISFLLGRLGDEGGEVEAAVSADCFENESFRRLYLFSVMERAERGFIDPTLAGEGLREVTGKCPLPERYPLEGLFEASASIPAHLAREYANELASRARERKVRIALSQVGGLAEAKKIDQETIGEALRILERGALGGESGPPATVSELLPQYLTKWDSHGGEILGMDTYMEGLREIIEGLRELVILNGIPGSGKSILSLNWVLDIARGGPEGKGERFPCIFYSFEMSKERLSAMILSRFSGLPESSIRKGLLIPAQKIFRDGRVETLRNYGSYISLYHVSDFSGGISPALIRTHIAQAKRRTGKKSVFVVIDPFQVYALQVPGGKSESVKELYDRAIGELKSLQVSTESVFLLTSHILRGAKGSGDIGTYMGNAGIEYAADITMALLTEAEKLQAERKEYRDKDLVEIEAEIGVDARRRRLSINKQKDGPTGAVTLSLHGETATFKEVPAP